MKLQEIYSHLSVHCEKEIKTNDEASLKNFLERESRYLYLIIWSDEKEIFSWGTMSMNSNRIRKSSLLNKKLTGKYDRRVDYLMLKKLYPNFTLRVYKTDDSLALERNLKTSYNQKHCYHGISGENRNEISLSIYSLFKETQFYQSQCELNKSLFDDFFHRIFLGKQRHPVNPKRTFFWGDCLEPKFLRTIEENQLEPAIEKILDVKFYK